MRKYASSSSRRNLSICTVILLLSSVFAAAQHESVVYAFGTNPGDGTGPDGGLIADSAGNLYGVTGLGGSSGAGTVYELSPPVPPNLSWNETVLYNFTGGADAAGPIGPLVFDAAGNLYGTTNLAVPNCQPPACGTAFEISPPAVQGGSWTETTIYTFSGGNDGAFPYAGLAIDHSGNLYGTTGLGGTGESCVPTLGPGCGTVFELSPPVLQGGAWAETVLYSFTGGLDGGFPEAAVTIDNAGNLYGTTDEGGSVDCNFGPCGTVFELTPSQGGVWTETVIHNFGSFINDGSYPSSATLFLDKSGALVGTTPSGGKYGSGTVFGLRPPRSQGRKWGYQVLYSFGKSLGDGLVPKASVVAVNGVLYGTTFNGGAHTVGAAFQLTFKNRVWKETALYSFSGSDGKEPEAGLLLHDGALYGTAGGGSANGGTVFRIGP